MDTQIREAGEQAIFEVRTYTDCTTNWSSFWAGLKYRTSYGQNVLKHSIEVAHLAGMMACRAGRKRAL